MYKFVIKTNDTATKDAGLVYVSGIYQTSMWCDRVTEWDDPVIGWMSCSIDKSAAERGSLLVDVEVCIVWHTLVFPFFLNHMWSSCAVCDPLTWTHFISSTVNWLCLHTLLCNVLLHALSATLRNDNSAPWHGLSTLKKAFFSVVNIVPIVSLRPLSETGILVLSHIFTWRKSFLHY